MKTFYVDISRFVQILFDLHFASLVLFVIYLYIKKDLSVYSIIYKYKEEKRYSEKLIFKKHAFVPSLNLLFFLILYKNLRRIYSSSPPPLLSFFLFLRPGRPSAIEEPVGRGCPREPCRDGAAPRVERLSPRPDLSPLVQ